MLGHNHISNQPESKFTANFTQLLYNYVAGSRALQQWQLAVATKCQEVKMTPAVDSLQSRRHLRSSAKSKVNPKTQVPNSGTWGTRRLSPLLYVPH